MNGEMKTKRMGLILILYIICVAGVQGQPVRVYAGGKAGVGMPSLATGAKSTPLNEDYAFRLTYYGGFVMEVQSDKLLSFLAEINYSTQGGERYGMQALPLMDQLKLFWDELTSQGVKHDNYMYSNLKSQEIFNYVEMPLMAKATFGSGRRFNFYLSSGPFVGVLIRATSITRGINSIYLDKEGINPVDKYLQSDGLSALGKQSFNKTVNITGNLNRYNVGWQGSIGFEIITKSGKMFMELGGNYGFIPIQKDESNGSNTTDNAIITIGYMQRL